MATRLFTGRAPLVAKVITVAAPGTGGATKLGFPGGPYVEHTSWDAATLVSKWNAFNHPMFQEITASQSSTSVVLTHKTAGEDFHVEALISGVSDPDLPQVTATTPGRGPGFFMDLDNWKDRTPPDSQDKIVIDDALNPIRFDIDLVQTFDKYGTSGGFTTFRLTSKKAIFVDNQKVRVQSSNTLPSGMSAGYYYVKSPTQDGIFFLSTDTTLGNRLTSTSSGTGTHKIGLHDIDLHVYARFSGARIGLPRYRLNQLEYLPTELNCWFKTMIVCDPVLGGNGLSLGRFDAEDSAVTGGVTLFTSQSSQDNYPAVCFKFNNAAVVFVQRGGDAGLAVHDGETCSIDHIEQTGETAQLIVANTTTDAASTLLGNYRFYRSTIAGVTNQFIA